MISTKGRYCLRVMVDLAKHYSGSYIPMKEVAERQGISLKYLEKILPVLTKNALIEGVHGKGGGYRLTREPDQYSVWEVLRLAEGELAPVPCLASDAKFCDRAADCSTLSMWQEYYELTRKFFESRTIADLAGLGTADYYVI